MSEQEMLDYLISTGLYEVTDENDHIMTCFTNIE